MRDRRKQEIDMLRVVAFALFSARPQREATRIRWVWLGISPADRHNAGHVPHSSQGRRCLSE